MNKLAAIGLVYICFSFCNVIIAQQNNKLIIVVKNIELIQGNLFIQLSSDSIQFQGKKEPNLDLVQETEVIDHEMSFTYQDIKPGDYAVAIFQDINKNGQLDTRKFGIPAEPFAFSNNAMRRFGPPHFSQAKFTVLSDGVQTQELNLIYRKPKKDK